MSTQQICLTIRPGVPHSAGETPRRTPTSSCLAQWIIWELISKITQRSLATAAFLRCRDCGSNHWIAPAKQAWWIRFAF